MSADPTAVAPSAPRSAGQRRLPLLVATVVFGVVFGLLAGVAFAAWSSALLGAIPSLVVGLLWSWGLSLFLAVRATLALKRRSPDGVLLRRWVALFLVALVQTTAFLAGVVNLGQGRATMTQELAAAALPLLGALPGAGPWLTEQARAGGLLDDAADARNPRPSTTGTDAVGQAASTTSGLAPRTGGRPVGTVAAGVQTGEGDLVVVVWTVLFGGRVEPRVVELGALSSLGPFTRVESSMDGVVAAVLGGGQLIVASPGSAPSHEKAMSRGARIGDLEVQGLRDVAVAPGGALIVVADVYDPKANKTLSALVARAVGGAPVVVRKAGEVVDASGKNDDPQDVVHAFLLKRGNGSGSVVVEEEFLKGGVDVGTKVGSARWTLNPRRLLAGQLDNPRAFSEVARSGIEPSGVTGFSLQAFGDAVLLPDGRVVFDANAAEEGSRGWLFAARAGSGVFAVAPELLGKPEAPWGDKAPRARHLSLSQDGAFAFVNRDGAVVVGPLSRPAEAKTGVLRADVVVAVDGRRAGGVTAATTARLLGADWLVAGVDVAGAAGARGRAIVLAGPDDRAANKVELLVEQGGLLPSTTPPAPTPADAGVAPASPTTKRVKSIFFDDGHDELLWQPG